MRVRGLVSDGSEGIGMAEFEFEVREEAWFADHAGKWTNRRAREDRVGTAEAAEILGVERPRIGRWIEKGKMPMPVSKLAATPVWKRSDIEAMVQDVEARRRQPVEV